MRTTGALEKKLKSEMNYKIIVKTSSNDHLMTSKQIEKVCNSYWCLHILYYVHTLVMNNIMYEKNLNCAKWIDRVEDDVWMQKY